MVNELLHRRFAGRQVLVAGATGALGRACAFQLHAAGARLVLLGRRLKALEHLDDALRAAGADPALYPLNLEGATAQDYADLASRLAAEAGGLDGFVWAAGQSGELMPVEDFEPADWLKLLHVNLHAPAFLLSALAPLLRQRSGFAAIALNDPALYHAAFFGAYGAAQAALRNVVHSLAEECQKQGPQVLGAVLPAFRSTLRLKLFPAEPPQRPALPDAVAAQLLGALAAGRHGVSAVHDQLPNPQPLY